MLFFKQIKLNLAVVVFLLIALLVAGCVKQPLEANELGGDFTVKLSTKSVIGQSKEDNLVVSDIRIIVMKGSAVVFNQSTTGGLVESEGEADGTSVFVLPLKQGDYKIAVVGNETPQMTKELDAIKTFAELSAIKVVGLFTEANVPLYRELDVTVRHLASDPTKGEVQINGASSWSDKLDMPLERIQTRVSLFVRKNTGNDKVIVINKAELAHVPTFVYLSPQSFNHTSSQAIVTYDDVAGVTLDANRTEDVSDNTSYTEVFSKDNIFHENRMKDPSGPTYATSLQLQGTYGGQTVNYQFDININNNFELRRNVHYKIYATIRTNGDIESQDVVVSPELWNGEKIDVELLTPYLNVQELNLNITLFNVIDENHYHLHYWTNQTSTFVEPKMKRFDDISGDQVMDVSTVFNELSGQGAKFNHFDTGVPGSSAYTGYLEIEIKKGYDFPQSTNQFKIVLNANGLRREITITIAKTVKLNPTHIGYTPWIGTFHRWNQVGERVIAAEHSGTWSAKVMDDVSNKDNFVVITKSLSTDPALGTDNPDDAENHKLLGSTEVGAETLHDATSTTGVVGTGAIYFRIGLKSKLASPTTAPRYARVELTTSDGGVQYLYVRQGEADDYIYAPNGGGDVDLDLVSNDVGHALVRTELRSKARKISPYNLGVARPTAGGSAFNSHYQFGDHEKAVFVNYPTMAGWYFTWYFSGSTPYYNGPKADATLVNKETRSYRKAYHPYNPMYHDGQEIDGFPSENDHSDEKKRQYLNYVVDLHNDPCPIGYEMMSSKEALHSLYRSYFDFKPVKGESFQFNVQDRAVINYKWGYYADGYYDRRPTRSLAKGGGDNYYRPFQLAGYNSDVAYMGALFYNHNTDKNNSVFLPGAGLRASNSVFSEIECGGGLQNIGGRAVYFLADSYYDASTPKVHNGVGVIELGAAPGSSEIYQAPTSTTYAFNFSFRSVGANATPMRCVKMDHSAPVAAALVFDWNGAIPNPANSIVTGTTNNHFTAPSGSSVSIADFEPPQGATFTKDGSSVVFKGWNAKADGTGTDVTNISMTLPAGVSILYAQWL